MRGLAVALGLMVAGGTMGGGLAAQQPDGPGLYAANCRFCHGRDGVPSASQRATYKKIRAFSDSGSVATMSVDSVVTVLTKGIDQVMKSYSERLTQAEIQAVAAYIKELAAKQPPKP